MSTAKIPPKPPKPSKETVYVDIEDEITAIIDKVESAKEKIVALVLPKRSTALQSIVNMRLLKRSAEQAAKNVVLITNEDILLPLAGAAGLHVAKNLQSKPEIPKGPAGLSAAEKDLVEEGAPDEVPEDLDNESETPSTKLDYHRSIGELATAHTADDTETVDLEDEDEKADGASAAKEKKPKKDKKLRVPNFDRFRVMLGAGILLLVGLVVFIILALFVLPKATIAITTESSPVSANLNLTAADSVKALDETKNEIPAIVKTTQQTSTQQAPATGQQNNGQKASGTMVFYNCNQADTLSGTNHTVAAGTAVTSNSLTYITQSDAVVTPSHFTGGGSCKNDQPSSSVNVIAIAGGAKFNQDVSSSYAVSGYSSISGSGSKMSGGTDNIATVVSQADVDSAKAKIPTTDTTKFTDAFKKSLDAQGFYIIDSTFKAADPAITANPAVGQAATATTVTIQTTYTVLVVQKSDLTTIIKDALNKQIDKNKQKLSADDVLKGATVSVQSQASPSSAVLAVSDETTAVPIIDINSIKKEAVGQKTGDIRSAISGLPGVKSVDVQMSPFWVSKAPKASKITVKLQQSSTKSSNGGG